MAESNRGPKPTLDEFLARLYRLRLFKFGQLEDRFIIMDAPTDIFEMVDICKKWCFKNGFRFMGVKPLFERLTDETKS